VQAAHARRGLRAGFAVLAAAGFALGVLSLFPTLVWVFIERYQFGIARPVPGDVFGTLVFYVASVGLREELVKLLCFAPLLPVLLRMDRAGGRGGDAGLEALLLGGCVGLGFAAGENVGFLEETAAVAAPGRFLTANFLHLMLTGLAAHSLYRAVRYGGGCWNELGLILGAVILVHGFYNAFLSLPALDESGILSLVAFALGAFEFLRRLGALRERGETVVSLSATFYGGFAVLLSAVLVHLTLLFGLQAAIVLAFGDVLGLALVFFIFAREVPETIQ